MWFFISNVVNVVGFIVMYPSYVVYKVVRFTVNVLGKLVLFLSYGVYRIVKLIFFPVLILVKPKSKSGMATVAEQKSEKAIKVDAKKLRKAKALEEKQLRIEKEKEEKCSSGASCSRSDFTADNTSDESGGNGFANSRNGIE